MPITVQCTHCGAQLKLKDRSKVGRKVGCPKCRKPFVIQAPATDDEFDFPDLDEFGGNYGAALPPKRAPERRRSGSGGKRKKKSSGVSGKQMLLIGLGVAGVLGLVLVVGIGFWIYSAVNAGVDQLEQLAEETDVQELMDETVSELETAAVEQVTKAAGSAPAGPTTGFGSPEAAFDNMKAGIASQNWGRMASSLTDESQEMMAGGLVLMGGLVAAFGGEETAGIAAVMERHGIDMEEGPGMDENGDFELPIRDKPAFIADMMTAMAAVDGGLDESPIAWAASSTLADLNVNGDTATATVVTNTDEGEVSEPIEFYRADGTWLVHLPEEAFQVASGPPEPGPAPTENTPTDQPQRPLPEQTLENGLTTRLAVYRERPFEFLSLGQNFPDNALYATIELVGPQIPACYEYGHFQIETAEDDQSRGLKVIGGVKTDFGEEFANEFIELDSFFLDEPNTLPIRFVLEPESGEAGSIARLEASVKLKVRPVVVVEDILSMIGSELAVDELRSVGTFKVVQPGADEAKPGEGIVIEYTGPDERVDEMLLLDGNGEQINASRVSFGFGRQRRFIIDAGEKLPPDTQLSIALGGNEEILVVPLKFEDVTILQ